LLHKILDTNAKQVIILVKCQFTPKPFFMNNAEWVKPFEKLNNIFNLVLKFVVFAKTKPNVT